jgi:hypothetical protein
MKLPAMATTCFGIKQSEVEMEGKHYSSTTFYLPAELAESSAGKTLGSVTVPYKFGDAAEFKKWEHLSNSWPETGLPVMVQFELVAGRDARGKDTGKLQLIGIQPAPHPRAAAAAAQAKPAV